MANWVKDFLKRNPELMSKPTILRGRNHIAFEDKGETMWNFVGSPVHYLDGKIWKPIDTKLIAMGNEYGSDGLRTRIKLDGSIRIIDDELLPIHSQKTTRVGNFNAETGKFTSISSFPKGLVSDDSIIREIGNFQHKLTLVDRGLREYLIINSATDVSDWLVLETELGSKQLFPDGWIDDIRIAEYLFPRPHTYDSKGKEILTKRYAKFVGNKQYIYTGILGSSLIDIIYPVIIDPDYLDSTNDGYIKGISASYSTARSTASEISMNDTHFGVGQMIPTTVYYIYRAYLKFDTSAIPDGDTVTQVNLKMVCIGDYSTTDFDVQIVKQDWSAQDPITDINRETAYDNCLAGTADDNIWRNTSGIVVGTQYASGILNTAWINKTGSTYYSLRSSRDYGNNTPTGHEYMDIGSQDNITVAYRPILTVLSTTPGNWFLLSGQNQLQGIRGING